VSARICAGEYVRCIGRVVRAASVVLAFDEVQAGFGRTGRFWAFEHLWRHAGFDLLRQSISGSLPLSAVIGRAEIMDQFSPGR